MFVQRQELDPVPTMVRRGLHNDAEQLAGVWAVPFSQGEAVSPMTSRARSAPSVAEVALSNVAVSFPYILEICVRDYSRTTIQLYIP